MTKPIRKLVRTRLRCIVTGEIVGCAPPIFEKRAAAVGGAEHLIKTYVSREGRRLLREDFQKLPPRDAVDAIRKIYDVTDTLPYPTIASVEQIRKWAHDPDKVPGKPGRKADPAIAARRAKEKNEKEIAKAKREEAKKAAALNKKHAAAAKAPVKAAAKAPVKAAANPAVKVPAKPAAKVPAKAAPAVVPANPLAPKAKEAVTA